jgi:hypothetical protein
LNTLRQEIESIDNKLYQSIKNNLQKIHQAKFAAFNKNFITNQDSPIIGIPENPSYLKMLFKSLQDIKHN